MAALLAALLAVLAVAGTAAALPASAAEAGLLRVAHLSPDTPAVDVRIDPVGSTGGSGPVIGGVSYGTVSEYRSLAPGTYAVALRAAGSPATAPPVLSRLVEVPAGAARTVAAVGRFDSLALRVLDDDLSAPPPGRARVQVLGASTAAPLDVSLADGTVLARALPFPGAAGWTTVPGGPATVRVSAAGSPPAEVPLDLAAGSVSTLLVLDRPDAGLTVRLVVDAGGPAVVPVGPVPAGGGGTAGGFPLRAGLALAAVLAGAVLLLAPRRSAAEAPTVPAVSRRRVVRPVLAVVTVAAGTVAPLAPPPTPPAAPVTPAAATAPVLVAAPAPEQGAPPVRLRAPAVGIDSPLAALRVDAAGTLVPPGDVATAGWFSQGPAPGDVGPAVVAGHVDSTAGPGAFFRLHDLRPGDAVAVLRSDGSTADFTVLRVASYPKTAFPTADVYGPTTDPELRLVTCGGDFDRRARSYVDNVVVYARAT